MYSKDAKTAQPHLDEEQVKAFAIGNEICLQIQVDTKTGASSHSCAICLNDEGVNMLLEQLYRAQLQAKGRRVTEEER